MKSKRLQELHERRDRLMLEVWSVMRDISDHHVEMSMTDEDLAVWGSVTSHSAIQRRLDDAVVYERDRLRRDASITP
jgi:hypothetical protein